MRCLACNVVLTDFEATRKYETGSFIDLCNHCFHSGVSENLIYIEREDLRNSNEETLKEDYFDAETV